MELLIKTFLLLVYLAAIKADSESCTVPEPIVCPSQAFDCPFNEDGNPEDGAFPDPDDPQRYYNCAGGVAYGHLCPQGSVFLSEFVTSNCTYQLCVEAQERIEEVQHELYSAKVVEAKDKKEKEFTKKQSENVLNVLIPKRNKRDVKKSSQCEGLSNQPSCQSSNVLTCYQDEEGRPIDGTYAHPTQCSMYYHCKSNIAYPQVCPPNYAFSPQPRVRSCGYMICVPEDRGVCPVDGAWSEWSAWSSCSVSCGDGLRLRTRDCNNPPPTNGGRECPGSDLDLEECTGADCPSGDFVIFYASYNGSGYYPNGLDPVPFDTVHINEGQAFDPDRSIFNVPRNGLYYIALNVGVMGYRNVEYNLMVNERKLVNVLRRDQTHFATDTMSRDYIGYFEKDDQLRIVSGNDTGLDGGSFPEALLTSWVIFEYKYENISSAFFVANDRSMSVSSVVRYNTVLLSLGGNYSSGYFTLHEDGIYFISWGLGMHYTTADAHLNCVGSCTGHTDSGIWSSNNKRGLDTKARSFMHPLRAGARLYIGDSGTRYSDPQMQTYFSGFFYSTQYETNATAFSVYRSVGISSSSQDLNPLVFENTRVNLGNAYSNGTVTCYIEGYYFFHFSAGGSSNTHIKLWLLKNRSEKLAGIILDGSWNRNTLDVISKYVIVRLSVGETVNVMVEAFTSMSPSDKHVHFNGFLLR